MGTPDLFSPRPVVSRVCPALRRLSRGCRGFTLIEILVVIAIIAILAALVFPTIGNAIRNGQQTTSVNNLRQWGVGFAGSLAEYNNEMPSDGNPYKPSDTEAWFNRIPPQIKILPLKDAGSDLPNQRKKSLWMNPGAPVRPVSGVPFTYGYNDFLSSAAEVNMKFTRVAYPAKTVLMAEKLPDNTPIVTPGNLQAYYGVRDPLDKDATANVLFCDGHVESVKRQVFTQPAFSAVTDEDGLRVAPFLWQPFENATP